MAFDDAAHTDAGDVPEPGHRRKLPDLAPRGRGHGSGDRVLGRGLDRPGEAKDVCPRLPVERRDLGELHAALRDRAGLVEDDRPDPARLLEHLGPLDEDPELRAAARPDHESRRGRETERARAGDDENRDRGGERVGGGRTGDQPAGERGERDRDHDGDEHRRDAVGEALNGRLSRLCVLDEARDLRQRGVRTDLRRPHDEAPVRVDRRARDVGSRADLDREGLAREQRLVDGGLSLHDLSVGRDLLAGPNDEQVADDDVLDRDGDLLAVPEDACVLRAELEELANCLARAALRPRLEIATQQDQRRDHGRDLEVRVLVEPPDEHDRGPEPRSERPHRDERVHRRGEVASALQRDAVKAGATPEDDRRR